VVKSCKNSGDPHIRYELLRHRITALKGRVSEGLDGHANTMEADVSHL